MGCPLSHLPKMNQYSDYKMFGGGRIENQYIYYLVFMLPNPWLHNTPNVLFFLEGRT